MPLSSGDQLGPYAILSAIGAGGMGEVYKARDTRLERTVAIKVLPEHIAQREDARTRFEREARAVGSLKHPNICTLYDIGDNYMVMELIEGETLSDRISRGAIPLEQALAYAVQIADALDRAHRAGVTHRDVKPQNIMLTRDGVKVLDFGLAKSSAKPGPTEETLTKVLTAEGTVMGTPQYMAPEQFEGKEADPRSDIWAFGAVLYEMVTGRKAFEEKSYASLVGAILAADPPPMAVSPFPPAWLERLVRRCLEKDADDRYQSMRDLVIDLKARPTETSLPTAKPSRWAWVAAALAMLGAVSGWGLWLQRKPVEAPRQVRFEIAAPGSRFIGRFLTISPDGQTLAWADESKIYVRDVNGFEARALLSARLDGYLFWSPDSRQIGYREDGVLKRVPLTGGAPQNICEARSALGVEWTTDNRLILGTTTEGLLRVPVSGGTPEKIKVTGAPVETAWMVWPALLPGGKRLAYVAQSRLRPSAVLVGEFQADGSLAFVKELRQGSFGVRCVRDADGRSQLFFLRGSSLVAQAFDPESLELRGDSQVVADSIGIHLSRAFFAVADGGAMIFRADQGGGARPELVERSGKGEAVRSVAGQLRALSLSPDGRSLLALVMSAENVGEAWVLDPERGTHTRLTFGDVSVENPVWSPDGKRVAYESGGLWIKPVDGSGAAEKVGTKECLPWSWSHDGKYLLLSLESGTTYSPSLYVVPMEGDRKPTPYFESAFSVNQAQFSPDDRWVAYVSDESGSNEVYVRRFPDSGERIRISNSGGYWPRWSRDGRELFYVETGSAKLMSVKLRYGKTLEADVPETLFDTRLPRVTGSAARYDVMPDGRRFVMVRDPETLRPDPLKVILNWQGGR